MTTEETTDTVELAWLRYRVDVQNADLEEAKREFREWLEAMTW